MKIKIRPDDVGAPGGNEWAEMNGWLADLRDDSAEGPVMDGQRGPADAGQQDPADVHTERPVIGRQRGPADAGQQDPADVHTERPVIGRQRGPADAGQEDPARTSWAPQRYPAPARSGVSGNRPSPGPGSRRPHGSPRRGPDARGDRRRAADADHVVRNGFLHFLAR